MTYLCCLNVALLEDLLDDLVLVRCAELVLESGLAGGVQDTLSAVAENMLGLLLPASRSNSLVGDQNLEAANDLRERNARVLLPLLYSLGAVNEDNEVLGVALVVDLGLSSVATSHDVCVSV